MGKPMHFPYAEVYHRIWIGWKKGTHTMGKVWVSVFQTFAIAWVLLHFPILWEIYGETYSFPIWWHRLIFSCATFLFYRLFDNVLMKTFSLCGPRGEKNAIKETKTCGGIASKWIFFYFKVLFALEKNELSIFHFLFTLPITKNNPPAVHCYYKLESPVTRASKLSTVSRALSSLYCFPWNSFESKDSFCCTNNKIKF